MSLFAVTMVRDELDVLPYTLAHLVSEGVDGMVIADNRSADGTRDWLKAFARSAPIPVTVLDDDEVGYYQSRKMTQLYRQASDAGADWVIPFDADEVWYSLDGRDLSEFFAGLQGLQYLEVSLFNYFPTSTDDSEEPNPFMRIRHRDPEPAPLAKVAVAGGIDSLVIEQGNHDAHADVVLAAMRRSGLAIGHFPWRSPEQYERKVRNGAEAYRAATDVPPSQGEHWRNHGRILSDGGPAALRAVYDEWYSDPPIDLEESAVPWQGFSTQCRRGCQCDAPRDHRYVVPNTHRRPVDHGTNSG